MKPKVQVVMALVVVAATFGNLTDRVGTNSRRPEMRRDQSGPASPLGRVGKLFPIDAPKDGGGPMYPPPGGSY